MTLIYICLGVVVLCLIMQIRNETVFGARRIMIKRCSEKANDLIFKREPWRIAWEPYNKAPSYHRMMFDFTKWTKKQFVDSVFDK